MGSTITIDCPDKILEAMRTTPEQFEPEARVLLAMKLFELGRLTSGQAAQLAGLERTVFLHRTGQYDVSILPAGDDELRQDIENARHRRQ